MNLPHQKPILFAKKIIHKDEKSAKVVCEFESIPSLGMTIEAAAQSCGAMAQEKMDGFLAGINSVKLLKEFDKQHFTVSVEKLYEMDGLELFCFEVEEYVKGKVAIYVK